MSVICLQHPSYTGTVSPDLQCKACVGIFIAGIKKLDKEISAREWMEKKAKEVTELTNHKAP